MGQEEVDEKITRHSHKKSHMRPEETDPFPFDCLGQEFNERREDKNAGREPQGETHELVSRFPHEKPEKTADDC